MYKQYKRKKIYVLRLKKQKTFLLAYLIISHNNNLVVKNKYNIVYIFNKCMYLLIDANGNLKYIVIYAQNR